MGNDTMKFKLSQIIRKNITIRNLSMMLDDIVTELKNEQDSNTYTGYFQDIQTLIDCILDETNVNDRDLSELQGYFENIVPAPANKLGSLPMDDIIAVENLLKLPPMSLYCAIQEIQGSNGDEIWEYLEKSLTL